MKNIFILLILLCSCQTDQEIVRDFTYVKDPSTNICFAMWAMGGNGSTMTYVPCTPEVEKRIELDSYKGRR
jgi:hypothetical protein